MKFLKIQEEIAYSKKRHMVQRHMEDLFIEAGYTAIEPSFFEDYDDFIDINKRVKKESMVKVLNGYGNLLILRPDITTSIIKNLMPQWEENLKLKLFYCSTIFESKINSNIDEYKQFGVEYLGEDSFLADCEVIRLSLDILKKYEENFILELGTSKYLNGLLKELNLGIKAEKDLKILIYNKNQFELDSFIKTLSIQKDIEELLKHLLDFQGSFEMVIEKAKSYYTNEEMRNSLNELEALKTYIEERGGLKNTYFDLSMVATFDYYEGITFKGYYPNVYRPILSGGRYDALTKRFGKNVSAVGFSIDINELMKALYKEEI